MKITKTLMSRILKNKNAGDTVHNEIRYKLQDDIEYKTDIITRAYNWLKKHKWIKKCGEFYVLTMNILRLAAGGGLRARG